MFKLYFAIVVLGFICLIEYKKYKHLLVATVVYPLMWIFSFVGVIYKGDEYYEVGWITILIILFGYILFILGFSLIVNRKNETKTDQKLMETDDIGGQNIGLNLIVIISFVILIMTIFFGLKYIDFNNILGSLVNIKRMVDLGEKPFPYIVVVSRYFLRCAIWYLSLVFFRIPKGTPYKTKEGFSKKAAVLVRLVMLSFMALIVMFTDVSRNDILMTFLPVIFIYILTKKLKKRHIVILVAICAIAFLLFFIIFRNFKGGAVDQLFDDENRGGRNSIVHYLSCGIPAIDQLYKENRISLLTLDGDDGRHTFSLFTAIIDMLFSTDLKPNVLQTDIYIGSDVYTNVYTFYQWLGMDFGLIYAMGFNIVLGMLYAFLYKKVKKESFGAIYWYSVLSYPLCMMFFEDQYLAIAQTWLIIVAFTWIIFFICNTSYMKARYINNH